MKKKAPAFLGTGYYQGALRMIGQPLKVCVGGLPARGYNYVNNQIINKMPYLIKTIHSIKGVPLIDYCD